MPHLLPDEVIIGDRQREIIGDIDSLARSIDRYGLIHPIVVNEGKKLLAGYRRLIAWKKVRQDQEIPVTLFADLPEHIQKEIELEENIRRKDLTWQEKALAILEYHELREVSNSEWNVSDTAEALNTGEKTVSRSCVVGRVIREEPEDYSAIESLSACYNLLQRSLQRRIDVEKTELDDTTTSVQVTAEGETAPEPELAIEAPVMIADFNEWASSYSGEKFNLVHCDFPFGIGHGSTQQSRGAHYETYDDEEEIYFRLINSLMENQDRLLSPAAHIMFWFSMNNYTKTVELFKEVGLVVNPFPMIWFKNDSRAILPDPKRGPRRSYETALLITRGDRYIVRPIANLVPYPAGEKEHISEKPEGMLKQFFRMLVDDTTRMLDPTCGAGSALRAADRMGAGSVLGLEINKDTAEQAANLFYQPAEEEIEAEIEI